MDDGIGGLDGVFIAEGVGVAVLPTSPTFSRSSPNSFHSTTSSKS